MTFITFLFKWLHLVSVIGVLGTAICLRFVISPALQEADSEVGKRLFRYAGRISGILWGVILLTGLFNLFQISAEVNKGYHMAIGVKITLALFMLGVTTVLSHPSPRFAALQENRSTLLSAVLILGVLIVGLSAHLNISRITGTGLDKPVAATATP